jgi:ABC-type nitrate/sulfonate/bicarbonate transport system ATPase subunit
MTNKLAIQLKNVRKSYGDHEVIKGIDLKIQHGQVVSIIGGSGSGKSTLLSIIAGQVFADYGESWVGSARPNRDRLIAGHPGVVWVKQDFGLSPYRSVRDNLLDLVLGKLDGEEDRLVRRMMRTLGLGMDPSRPAHSLSGGEQQRLSIGRALLGRPRVLLLDEPFSHVDGFHKERLLQLLTAWQRKTRCTVVLVAHDVRDAARWAHRIDVLQDGLPYPIKSILGLRDLELHGNGVLT